LTLGRAVGLLVVAYLGLLFCSALAVFVSWPLPDLGLLVALYAGLTCRLRGGVTAVLRDASPVGMLGLGAAIGYLADLVGGSPRGLRALAYALLLLGLRALAGHLLVRGAGAVAAVATVTTLLLRGLLLLLQRAFDPAASLAGLRGALGQAILTGVVAPLVFYVLSRIDSRLWRDPRTPGLRYENEGS
jgi:cell shape-determining protein MreD